MIKKFEKLGELIEKSKSISEYCKPHSLEYFTQDYDDVCEIAIFILKILSGTRVEDF